MSDNNDAVLSQENVSVNEVNQPSGEIQSDAQNSEQGNKIPESVPYDRFAEVNREKNELRQKYEEQIALTNQYAQSTTDYINQQQNTQPVQEPQIETVDDVMSYINSKIEERVKPIEQQRFVESYENNVKSWFNQDKQANEIKDQIDSYYTNLPDYRQQSIVDAVSRGDVSVLNEIKNTVMLQHNNNLKSMANESVANDINKMVSPQSKKVIRDGEPSMNDLINEGAKTGNFDQFFSAFSQKAFQ